MPRDKQDCTPDQSEKSDFRVSRHCGAVGQLGALGLQLNILKASTEL